MARLDFDFHASATRRPTLGIVLLLAGLGAVVWAGLAWQQARATVAGQQLQLAAFENARPTPGARPATRAEEAISSSQAEIAAQLRFSWQPAFEALANARSNAIALVSLDATRAKAQLKLVAEARQLSDAVEFLNALQQQRGVRRAELLQHELQKDDAQKPVRFTVLVDLRPTELTP
ncbi:MAG: hypothetical protein IV085_05590 [Thiobacillus sp.]|nr:hypothetical protein [Thiobacillus sp.]